VSASEIAYSSCRSHSTRKMGKWEKQAAAAELWSSLGLLVRFGKQKQAAAKVSRRRCI